MPSWSFKAILDGAGASFNMAWLTRASGYFAAAHALVDTINLVDVTLSVDTNAYASGDVIADTQVVADAVFENDGQAILHSLTLIDKADQKVAMTALFFSANVSLGTENAAPSISDADALNFLCAVDILTTDWRDLGGVAVCELSGLSKFVKAATGSKSVYMAVLNGSGTPTFGAAGDLVARLGFLPG